MTQVRNGIVLNDPLPKIITGDTYPDMLILGGGACLWDDYFAAREILPSSYIMCVNDIGAQFKAEQIQHIVSLHRPILPAIKEMRRQKSMLESVCAHCDVTGVGVDCVWNMQSAGGTSGLFAVKIALALGSSKIIICGIPMDGSGHYFDPPDAKKNNTDDFSNKAGFAPWHDVARIQIASDRVRSMSGRTAQLFGKPTKEWVQS